ncbi:hypothetical protein BD779DRAFT_1436395 [Infundibulicybe gibba]|nr:hypothetical protein BD779DRAFT_1436395 [Infundibulicybe gibba]
MTDSTTSPAIASLKKGSDSAPLGGPTIRDFVVDAKTKYLSDCQEGKGGDWTVVVGNEAGGMNLDTIASAIAFAWFLSKSKNVKAVPLIQTETTDLRLRPENLYVLRMAGFDNAAQQLLCLDNLKQYKTFPSTTFALVDHNTLEPYLGGSTAKVMAVVDHHQDEGNYKDITPASFRRIETCGSCSSLITTFFTAAESLPAELATLLMCALLIDTDGLERKKNPDDEKAKAVDRSSCAFLAPRSTISGDIPTGLEDPDDIDKADAIQSLATTISGIKDDVSKFSAWDLVRRDYKEYANTANPNLKAGLCSVPSGFEDWATKGQLDKAGKEWMKQRAVSILGVCTSFHTGKHGGGKHKREMGWIIRDNTPSQLLDVKELASRVWVKLESSASNLDLKVDKDFELDEGENHKARVYKQGNLKANRKAVAPLVEALLKDLA